VLGVEPGEKEIAPLPQLRPACQVLVGADGVTTVALGDNSQAALFWAARLVQNSKQRISYTPSNIA
jgi:hypothetical protein